MRLADALVCTLRDWGIRFIFGVSGANVEHVHDAVHRLGEGRLRAVLSRSESGAAFMADAHARVHKTLGVCCATSGGGMMNLAVGIAEAFAESVPVLAIVGQPPSALDGRGAFQDSSGIGRTVDARRLWGAITKRTERIDDPEMLWEQLCACVATALEGRRGPVALLIPRDLYDREIAPPPDWFPADLSAFRVARPPAEAEIEALFQALRGAVQPVLVLGTGLDRCDDPAPVLAFARETGIAVATTMGSPGAYDPAAPEYIGMIGVAGHPSAHDYVNEQADVILAVGTGLDIMVRTPIAAGLHRASLLVVNVDPGAIERALPVALAVPADAGLTFAALRRRLRDAPIRYARQERPPSHFVPILADAAPLEAEALTQSHAIALLQEALPPDGHLLFDAGNCAAAALHYLRIPRGLDATIALGMGGMGYAIAGAIGAQLGSAPSARTVVLCGDGAFLMQGLEVHTAIEWELPILFVVFNNQAHGMCVTRQQLFFGGRIEASTYPPLDVAAVGRGLGSDMLWVASASSPAELARALEEYASSSCPSGLLELRLRREEVPPFTPFLGESPATTSRWPAR